MTRRSDAGFVRGDEWFVYCVVCAILYAAIGAAIGHETMPAKEEHGKAGLALLGLLVGAAFGPIPFILVFAIVCGVVRLLGMTLQWMFSTGEAILQPLLGRFKRVERSPVPVPPYLERTRVVLMTFLRRMGESLFL